ncbi:MAG: hypothetical protein JXC32_03725 [Anaerolineae bacterium]|nr:hypothetical protein [Anaerolineae bacterium]
MDLYRDHFMAGFRLEDSTAFDAWQSAYAESLKQEIADTLVRVADAEAALFPDGAAGSWSPDGSAIAVAYTNGDLRIYPAWETTEDLVAYAKDHCVVRNLTAEERARYGLRLQ